MILAAGRGTRLGGLTDAVPKPMLSIAGRPLLEHTLRALAAAGIEEAAMNLHHAPEAVREYFGDGRQVGVRLTYSYEPTLLGTAGGIKPLASFFGDDPFLVHYGDNLTSCNLPHLAAQFESDGGAATIALFHKDDVSPHSAVEIDDDRRILRFVEKPRRDEAPSHWISAGVLIVHPRVLDHVPEGRPFDFGFDLFPALLAAGERLYGYYMTGAESLWWIDTAADYARTSAVWQARLRGESERPADAPPATDINA